MAKKKRQQSARKKPASKKRATTTSAAGEEKPEPAHSDIQSQSSSEPSDGETSNTKPAHNPEHAESLTKRASLAPGPAPAAPELELLHYQGVQSLQNDSLSRSRELLRTTELALLNNYQMQLERSRAALGLPSASPVASLGQTPSLARRMSMLQAAQATGTPTEASSSLSDLSAAQSLLGTTNLLSDRMLLAQQQRASGMAPSASVVDLDRRRMLQHQLQALATMDILNTRRQQLHHQQQHPVPANTSLNVPNATADRSHPAAVLGLGAGRSLSAVHDQLLSAPDLLQGATQQFIGTNLFGGSRNSSIMSGGDILPGHLALLQAQQRVRANSIISGGNPTASQAFSSANHGVQLLQGRGAAMPIPHLSRATASCHGDQSYYTDSLREWDVLCARGGASNHHPGNKRYRHLVNDMKEQYHKLDEKTAKTDLSRAIVDHVANYGGRFVKFDKANNRYCVLSASQARKKVAQALRETKELIWTMKV